MQAEKDLLTAIRAALDNDTVTRVRELMNATSVKTIPLLTQKDFLIIANIAEDEIESDAYKKNQAYQKLVAKFGAEKVVPICAKVASELAQMS